jgi:hypothetical protein
MLGQESILCVFTTLPQLTDLIHKQNLKKYLFTDPNLLFVFFCFFYRLERERFLFLLLDLFDLPLFKFLDPFDLPLFEFLNRVRPPVAAPAPPIACPYDAVTKCRKRGSKFACQASISNG